jgi:putative FmdB family regulatory protein
MPHYDYLCADCGSFSEVRPMADSALPQLCPSCSAPAPRAILTAPRMAGMSSERRAAFVTNERSSHAPKMSGGRHPSGCGCCSGLSRKSPAATPPAAAKSFPSARPWMISH